jgi:hypothetical protein
MFQNDIQHYMVHSGSCTCFKTKYVFLQKHITISGVLSATLSTYLCGFKAVPNLRAVRHLLKLYNLISWITSSIYIYSTHIIYIKAKCLIYRFPVTNVFRKSMETVLVYPNIYIWLRCCTCDTPHLWTYRDRFHI